MGKYDMDPNLYNAFANRAVQSPGFSVGELLGQIWSKNYKDRGNQKVIDKYLQDYSTGPNAAELASTNQEVNDQNRTNDFYKMVTSDPKSLSSLLEKTNTTTDSSFGNRMLDKIAADNGISFDTSANSSVQPQREPMYTVKADFPGMTAPGNIDLAHRPIVHNPDGSISTVSSIGVNINGKEYLLPTISEDGKRMTNAEAVENFKKTGEHLGIFDSPESSTAYAKSLHEQQADMYPSDDGNHTVQTNNGPALSDTQQRPSLYSGSFIDNPANFQSGSTFDTRRLTDIAANNKILDTLQAKGYIPRTQYDDAVPNVSNYMDKAGVATDAAGNVTGVSSQPGAISIAQQAADERMKNFNAKNALANIKLYMMKNGYTADQIDDVTGTMSDKLQSTQDDLYQKKADSVISSMRNLNTQSPEYQQKIVELSRYSPDAANLLSKNVVNGFDMWKNDQLFKRDKTLHGYDEDTRNNNVGRTKNVMQYQHGLQLDTLDHQTANQVKLIEAQYQARNKLTQAQLAQKESLIATALGTNNPQAIAHAMLFGVGTAKKDYTTYNIAQKIAEDAEKKKMVDPNYQYTPTENNAIDYKNRLANKLFTYGDPKNINFNDYNQAVPFFQRVKASGLYSDADTTAGIRKHFGLAADDTSNEYVESIIRSVVGDSSGDDKDGDDKERYGTPLLGSDGNTGTPLLGI